MIVANEISTRDAAVALARSGMFVFPVKANSKIPATRTGHNAATRNIAKIHRWWEVNPAFNIGIACGPSDLVVIDCDNGKPWPTKYVHEFPPEGVHNGADMLLSLMENPLDRQILFHTAIVTTPSGGTHFYFARSGRDIRNSAGSVAPWIDVRSAGGYVLGPFSTIDGTDYEPASGWNLRIDADGDLSDDSEVVINQGRLVGFDPAIIYLPLAVETLVAREPVGQADKDETPETGTDTRHAIDHAIMMLNNTGSSEAYAERALILERREVAEAETGTRNHTLNKAAFSLARFITTGELTEPEIVDTLTFAAIEAGLEPYEISRTIQSGLKAGKRRLRVIA